MARINEKSSTAQWQDALTAVVVIVALVLAFSVVIYLALLAFSCLHALNATDFTDRQGTKVAVEVCQSAAILDLDGSTGEIVRSFIDDPIESKSRILGASIGLLSVFVIVTLIFAFSLYVIVRTLRRKT